MDTQPLGRVTRPVLNLLRTLNTPRSLAIFILISHGEWDQIVTMKSDPRNYLDCPSHAEKFRRDYQASDLLRKFAGLPSSFDLKAEALKTFEVCEKQCAVTNYMIDMSLLGGSDTAERLTQFFGAMRKIAHSIMGPLPPNLSGGYGPGTCFELKGSTFSTLADKMWVTPHVTRACEDVFTFLTQHDHNSRVRTRLGLPWVAYSRGNRFTTVPKDSKTNRGICIEPLGNLYCQLAIGAYLKERLSTVGIYVNRSSKPADPLSALRARPRPTGQDIHRRLSREGSRSGEWATIDLSNASDTVAHNLVREVIPRAWFELLSACRSPMTLLPDGHWARLEKFSSMGNGYTFELETLIFICAAKAVRPELVVGETLFVYGDDIIVPREASADVQAALRGIGFTPNPLKCFDVGPFRESCGGDYFCGYDVRPYYLRREPRSPQEWFTFHNTVRAKFHSALVLRSIVDRMPNSWKLWGPPASSNTYLFCSDPSSWRVRYKNGYLEVAGMTDETTSIPLDRWGTEFTVSLALLGVESKGITPRGDPAGYRTCYLSVS